MNGLSSTGPVGRVIGLWRYPVKSMAPEALTEADVGWHGLTGDRRWAFVREDRQQSGFPWLTLRDRADMGHYQPSFADPSSPDKSKVQVSTPMGALLDITDPALAEELNAGHARAIKHNCGLFDTFPISLISTQSIDRLSKDLGMSLDVRRFRPNILVEAHAGGDFPEDQWVGRVLRIGSLRMRVDKRDGRCAVITIDPVTTEREPSVLRAVASDRQGCMGVYGSTVEPGRVRLADPVVLE